MPMITLESSCNVYDVLHWSHDGLDYIVRGGDLEVESITEARLVKLRKPFIAASPRMTENAAQ